MPADAKPSRWSWTSFAVAAASTVVVLGAAEVTGAWFFAQKQARDARRGWNLIPVLRATRDLERGAKLTREDLEAGSLPEQFVTSSTYKPEAIGAVVGQPLQAPLARGDWLMQAHLTPRSANCAQLVNVAALQAHHAGNPAVEKLVAALGAGDGGTP